MNSAPRSPLASPSTDPNRWHSLPKAELHLHLEGTLEPEMAFELARRNGVTLPFASPEALRASMDFADLQGFLDLYYGCMAALLTTQDFEDLASAYLDRAHAQGVRHAEIFVDPQAHLDRGVDVGTVLDGTSRALTSARERHGMSGGIIVCIVRDRPVAEAVHLVEQLAPRVDDILGIGLDSAEVGYPPELFTEVFARAAELGLHRVAHAGEEGPPEYIVSALDDLGVERVDHGIRCLEDADLVERLRASQIPLTVCPWSNVRLRAVDTMAQHPLREMMAAGLAVTINSDDPAYFGGYVGENFEALHRDLGLTETEAADLARHSIRGSFASSARKAELLELVDAWVAG